MNESGLMNFLLAPDEFKSFVSEQTWNSAGRAEELSLYAPTVEALAKVTLQMGKGTADSLMRRNFQHLL